MYCMVFKSVQLLLLLLLLLLPSRSRCCSSWLQPAA
jgi:hypothetical protein